MFEMESQLVNEDFVKRKDTYNLKEGGFGGFDYINKNCHNNMGNHRKTGNIGWKKRPEVNDEFVKKIKKGIQNYYDNGGTGSFLNKKHKEESKEKIGKANSIHQKGSKNSQFGTMWITDGISNKKIKKNDDVPDGWSKGRKIKQQ